MTLLPAIGKDIEALRMHLAEKQAEVEQLRERIELLERELTPRRVLQTAGNRQISAAVPPEQSEGSNRALERALVRENGMLLPVGQVEVEPNLVFSYFNDRSNDFKRSAFGPALTLRAGILSRTQMEFTLPYVFEKRSTEGFSTDSDGIGDATIGIAHQFLPERGAVPGIIGALTYQDSTGKNTVFESARPVAHGSGFNALQASITGIKRIDPLVFFGTYSFTHNRPGKRNGIDIDIGNSHGLRFGTGIATSPYTSLRAALNLNFYEKTKIDGREIVRTDDHMALLELGGSVVLSESTALDVLIGAGLTSNAPDYRVTVALPVRF